MCVRFLHGLAPARGATTLPWLNVASKAGARPTSRCQILMATLAQVALGPGPGEKAWQVCGILPCIFWGTDELEEEQVCSLSRSESTQVVDFQRVQDERSHGFNLWRKEGEWALQGAREYGQQPDRCCINYTRWQRKMQGFQGCPSGLLQSLSPKWGKRVLGDTPNPA